MAVKILPAVLARSRQQLQRQLQLASEYSSTVHLDIADGTLTMNRTVGPSSIATIRFGGTLEAHIMSNRPDRWLSTILAIGVRRVIVHVELGDALKPYIALFRTKNISVAIAINPKTSIRRLDRWAHVAQGIQVMGVVPGRLGARWHPQTVARIQSLRSRYPRLTITCDGGMTPETIPAVFRAGARQVVVGSFLQNHPDPDAGWQELRTAARAEV